MYYGQDTGNGAKSCQFKPATAIEKIDLSGSTLRIFDNNGEHTEVITLSTKAKEAFIKQFTNNPGVFDATV